MSVASEQSQLDHISKRSPMNIKQIINYLNLKIEQTRCNNIIKVFLLLKYKMLNNTHVLTSKHMFWTNILYTIIYLTH